MMTEATLEAHATKVYQETEKRLLHLGIYDKDDRTTFWQFLYQSIEEEIEELNR